MRSFKVITFLMAFVSFLLFQSCDEGENETKISSHGDSESHSSGQDCMKCHKSGEGGEGWFTLAGTMYNSVGNSIYSFATVNLYDEAVGLGSIVQIVEVDAKGNFYTTDDIDFGAGLYVSVNGNEEVSMHSKITTGACNSCHGVSADRLEVR